MRQFGIPSSVFGVAQSSPSLSLDVSASLANCVPRGVHRLRLVGRAEQRRLATAKAGGVFTVYLNPVPAVLGASYPVAGSVTDATVGSIDSWKLGV
jgi:hypothetical protein